MKLLQITLFIILTPTIKINAQNTYPGQGIIGKSYNVFGEYANNKSIIPYKLFDFSKMLIEVDEFGHKTPEMIYIENISDHIITSVEGSSITEYSKQFSEKAGLGGKAFFFKASFETQFKESYQNSESQFYYTYMDINTKWRTSLDIRDLNKVIPYLDSRFKKDLDSLAPKQLFELYGTHFISSAYLGGRIDYSSASKLNKTTSIDDIKMALKAKYGLVSGQYSEDYSTEQVLSNSKTVTQLNVVGGNAEFANTITNKEQYNKWADGISTAPVLCGFDQNSLIPIWMLTTNTERKKQLEDYFTNSLLPKYPLPEIFQRDNILDNTAFVEKFNVYVKGFYVAQDCDYYLLTGDEAGDFKYNINISANGQIVQKLKSETGKVYPVWSGDWLGIERLFTVDVPFKEGSYIEVAGSIHEVDDLQEEDLGSLSVTHKYPFSTTALYNTEFEETNYYRIDYANSADCRALLYYHISPFQDETAIDYGNKGWNEFILGNYEKAQYYNKEALKLDNTLWYIHYNIALIYLIQGNPLAIEKYISVTNNCTEQEIFDGALSDINEYEKSHGILKNSEQIKILLQSKL